MKFHSYDAEHDEIILLVRERQERRSLPKYIATGEVDRLTRDDRGKLYEQVRNHPKIVADEGVCGCFSFHLINQQNLFLAIGALYVALLVFCPVVFMRHFHVMGLEFTGGSILFPVTYVLLDSISELYGIRRARQTLIYTSSLLMVLGGAWWLHVHFLAGLVHGDHSHEKVQAIELIYQELPHNFFKLGLSLLMTDMINILLFHRIRSWMNNRWFWFRSLVSTSVALTIFSVVAPIARFGAYWNDSETLNFVTNVTVAKYPLVLIYLPIGLAIVYGARFWRRHYAKY
ncbi:VUT family protein [Endozoicomonas sp. ALB091]|uniref:VUT family protein n=1 Tax=Endozoicomonas sp. ALB091 TaxID=3403073 RepID=UPI003BB596CC